MPFLRGLAVVLGLSAITALARAATPEDEAGAERLFQEAKALMAEGRVHDACSKLEEAKRLEVGGGIVLALALCHEKDGRAASALAEFREALALAIEAQRADRVRLAEERAARLRETVSTLTLIVPEGTGVHVNHEPWDRARVGIAVPVDGGEYVVHAEAPGKQPWEVTLHIAVERDAQRIEIPVLADLDASPPPALAAHASARESPHSVDPTQSDEGRTLRIAGVAIAAGGALSLGVGVVFGVVALAKRSEADCGGHVCSGAAGTYGDAQTAATAATIAGVLGAVGIGAGGLLFLTGRTRVDTPPRAGVQLVPQVSAQGASIAFTGRF